MVEAGTDGRSVHSWLLGVIASGLDVARASRGIPAGMSLREPPAEEAAVVSHVPRPGGVDALLALPDVKRASEVKRPAKQKPSAGGMCGHRVPSGSFCKRCGGLVG